MKYNFYEGEAQFHEVETDSPLPIAVGDTLRLHTVEPSDHYVVERIHHEITIKEKVVIGYEIRVHLKGE